MECTLRVTRKAVAKKLEGKELEDFQVQELIEGIRKRLTRLEAEAETAASRYTVVFEIGPRNLGDRAVCWRARVVDHGIITAGETLGDAAGVWGGQSQVVRAPAGGDHNGG